jgi:hypothetical protein
VSFFDPPPPPPEPPEEAFERKPWWGAPRNEVGISTGLRLVLARTDEVAVALLDAIAFSTGLSFTLAVLRRSPDLHVRFDDPLGRFGDARRGPQELPPELLRFGIEFSDGRKATSLGMPALTAQEEDEPQGPFLTPGGGGGGPDYWETSFWLWPLPPPGRLSFVVEWPAEEIAQTRHEVETESIIEAAGRAEALWPPALPGSRGFGASRTDY